MRASAIPGDGGHSSGDGCPVNFDAQPDESVDVEAHRLAAGLAALAMQTQGDARAEDCLRILAVHGNASTKKWALRRLEYLGVDIAHERKGASLAPRLCDVARLRHREHLQFVPLADLPEGQGLGEVFDESTGGGLAPGSTIGIGAAGTGAGKSAVLMQVLDGLALRSAAIAEDPEATLPLTPVAIYSEMPSDMLENRTLGRLLGVSGHIFAAGRSAWRFHAKSWVDDHFDRAAKLMEPGGAYQRITAWQHFTRAGKLAGPSLVKVIEEEVSAWVEELKLAHPGREIVPIIALDPIDSFLSAEARSEIERMGEMIALADELADRRGWIVIVTVDTNKTSAIEGFAGGTAAAAGSLAAKVFRGTMALLHRLDLALVFDPGKADPAGICDATLLIDKNRTGPNGISIGLRWHKKTGLRFVPDTKAEHTRKADAKRAASDPATQMSNLVAVVRDLTDPAKNLYATEKKLRGKVGVIGTTEKKLPDLLTDAVKAGRIRQSETKKGQGGGYPYEVVE